MSKINFIDDSNSTTFDILYGMGIIGFPSMLAAAKYSQIRMDFGLLIIGTFEQ